MTAEEVLQANFAEKMRARAENRVPVIVTPAEPSNPNSESAIEERFRAKLAARHAKPAEPAEPEAAAKPEAPAAAAPAVSAAPTGEAAELAALEEATRPDGDTSRNRRR